MFDVICKCYVVEFISINRNQTENIQECEHTGSFMCNKMCLYNICACTRYMYNWNQQSGNETEKVHVDRYFYFNTIHYLHYITSMYRHKLVNKYALVAIHVTLFDDDYMYTYKDLSLGKLIVDP